MLIQLSKYQTIILDLGGVIIDIYPNRVVDALQDINRSGKSNEEIFTAIKSGKFIEKQETGEMSDEQFLDAIGEIVQNKDYKSIMDAWCLMLGEIPRERIETIKKLRQTHKVLLLSNTNTLHSDRIESYLNAQHKTSFSELFDQVFLSQKIGHRKPNIEIYKHVLETSGINATTSIFVDDVKENAKSAELVGIQGYHLDLSQYKLDKIFNHG